MNDIPWYQRTLVAFDTETTGVDVENDRIVTAAVITIDPSVGGIERREWLADPGVEIPAEATGLHGITTEMARAGGRPAVEVVEEIAEALAEAWHAMHPVIAYNASFDLSLLDRELRRHRGEGLWTGAVVDPFVIDKHYDKYRPGKRTLSATAAHYGVQLAAEDAHGAAADALAAARVAWKLAKVNTQLAEMRLPELHAHQEAWHAEQAAGLQRYFDRKGIREHVHTEWPLRPMPSANAAAS